MSKWRRIVLRFKVGKIADYLPPIIPIACWIGNRNNSNSQTVQFLFRHSFLFFASDMMEARTAVIGELTGGISRTATKRSVSSLHHRGGSIHKHVSPWDGLSDRTPRLPLARPFDSETLHAREQSRDKPRHPRAIAKPPLGGGLCNLVYSPQHLASSSTVQWLLSIPAAIAGVIFKALCVLQKL